MVLTVLFGSIPLAGCAVSASTSQECASGITMKVTPASAAADHSQAAPGDQVRFQAVVTPTSSPGCATPAWAMTATPTWANPDPKDISIDSSSDTSKNGLATCLGPTNGPVTLTATFTLGTNPPASQAVTLTCK